MGQDKLGQTNTGVVGTTHKTASQEATPVPEFSGSVFQPQFLRDPPQKVTFVHKTLKCTRNMKNVPDRGITH